MNLEVNFGDFFNTIKDIALFIQHYFSPYKKDKEVYEKIKEKLDDFYLYIKEREAGETFNTDKVLLLHYFYEKEYNDIELFFRDKNLKKLYQELKKSIKNLSGNLSEMYSLSERSSKKLVMNRTLQVRTEDPDDRRYNTYQEEINGSIRNFVASYEEFKKNAIKILYTQRIKSE